MPQVDNPRFDHFSVSGTETLAGDNSLNEHILEFRSAVSKMVGADNPPPPSRFSDCPDVDPVEVQAYIDKNKGLYLGALQQAKKIIVVEDSASPQGKNIMEDPDFCLWDAERDADPKYSTSKWLAAKEAFEAIPSLCKSSLRQNSLEDTSDAAPPLFSTTRPDELLGGLNLSLVGSAENILGLYQCGTINTKENVLGRWPLLEFKENNKKSTVSENEDKECVDTWGESNTQGPVMIRKGLKVSLEYRDSCYAAKEGLCDYTYYTLDQDGNLVRCSFEERNKKQAIFHIYMVASIDFSKRPPFARFDVRLKSTCTVFRYRGPKTNEIKRLENCDDPEQLKQASPFFPRRSIEPDRRSSSQGSDLVTHATPEPTPQTSNITNNPLLGQVPLPLSVAKQLGSDPERWAAWFDHHPFVAAVNGGLCVHFLMLAMCDPLRNTTGDNTLKEIKLHGWPIEASIAAISGWLAWRSLSNPVLNKKPGCIERGWQAWIKGIQAGLYGAVVADESIRLIKHSDWTLSRRGFLHYMLPVQVWFACMIAMWTFMKSDQKNRWRESHPDTASLLDGVVGTVSNGTLLGTGLLALLYTHPIVQLSTMVFMSTFLSCLERSSQGLMRCAKTIFDYVGTTLLTIALILELQAAFSLKSSEKKSTNTDDIVYARAALWFLLCVGSTAYMVYLARRTPSQNQHHTPESPRAVVGDNPSSGERHSIGDKNALGSPRSIDSDDPPATTEKSPLLGPNGEPRASYATDSARPSPVSRQRRRSEGKSVSFSPDLPSRPSQMDKSPLLNSSSSEQGSESPQSDSGGHLKLPYSHSPPLRQHSPLIFSKHFPEGSALPRLRLAGQGSTTPSEESGTEGDSEHEPPSPPPVWAFPGRGGGHSSRPGRGQM